MKWNNKFIYPKSSRSTEDGLRKYLIDGENKSWWARNVSPKIKVSDEGKKILDEKFEELKTQWLEIEMQFKSKDKNKLKNSLLANNSMLPLFMMMGFTPTPLIQSIF